METNNILRQVGGDHYLVAGSNQHWDMLAVCGYGWEYYKGRATAYLTRVKKPDEDTEKAGHFIEKLIWLIDTEQVPRIFKPTQAPKQAILKYLRQTYFPANKIEVGSPEADAIELIMVAQTRQDLQVIIEAIAKIEHDRLRRGHLGREAEANTDAPPLDNTGWPWPATPVVIDVDEAKGPDFQSGGGGDFGGGGATGRWDDAVSAAYAADLPDKDRMVVLDGTSAETPAPAPAETCARSDYSDPAPSPSYDSSSSYDSGSSSSDSSSSSSD